MSKQTINSLFKSYDEIVFVSPHLDDVALSCAQLMIDLVKQGKKVVVINVFTKAHKGPYTLSAKTYLKTSGNYKSATKFYNDRIREDEKSLSSIQIKRIINLGCVDALFRTKKVKANIGNILPEVNHLYPTYRWHITKNRIIEKDESVSQIVNMLKNKIKKNALVFSPLGIATHVDHTITRQACDMLDNKVVYYSEFPYNLQSQPPKETKKYQLLTKKVNMMDKKRLVSIYKTQFSGLFPGGLIPEHLEKLYIKQ